MKAIAYLASYKKEEQDFLEDLKSQKSRVEEFCFKNKITLGEILVEENFSKEDFKPILLKIINSINGLTNNLILQSPQIISNDSEFVLWVEEELAKINVKINYVMGARKLAVPPKNPKEHLEQLVKKIKSIPSLPNVVAKMLEVINDETSSLNDLSKLISYDTGLSAKVLKLVNSSYYGFSKRIGTIQHAITILGMTTIKGLVLSSSVFKTVGMQGGFNYKDLWAHNFLTAMASKLLARNFYMEQEEDIFSCAIMHDLGKFILAQYDFANYNRACELTYGSLDFSKNLEVEKLYCGTNHCEIGYMLAKEWDLPKAMLDVILYHHEPHLSRDYRVTCAIVQIADILSNVVVQKEPMEFDLFDPSILEEFSINNSDLYFIYEKLNSEMENVDEYMEFFD